MLIHFFFFGKGTLTLSSVNTFDTYESLEKIREKKWQHLYSYERCYQHWLQTAELSNIICAALLSETSDATQLGQITKTCRKLNQIICEIDWSLWWHFYWVTLSCSLFYSCLLSGEFWAGQAVVTQPMLQLRPNWSELRSMDYYHQIFCRFRKCKRKVPPPSPLSTQKSPFTPPKEDFSHPLGE